MAKRQPSQVPQTAEEREARLAAHNRWLDKEEEKLRQAAHAQRRFDLVKAIVEQGLDLSLFGSDSSRDLAASKIVDFADALLARLDGEGEKDAD